MIGRSLFTGFLDGRLDRRAYALRLLPALPFLFGFVAVIQLGAAEVVPQTVGRALEFIAFVLGSLWVVIATGLILQRGRDAGVPTLITLALAYGAVTFAPSPDLALAVGAALPMLAFLPPSDLFRRSQP